MRDIAVISSFQANYCCSLISNVDNSRGRKQLQPKCLQRKRFLVRKAKSTGAGICDNNERRDKIGGGSVSIPDIERHLRRALVEKEELKPDLIEDNSSAEYETVRYLLKGQSQFSPLIQEALEWNSTLLMEEFYWSPHNSALPDFPKYPNPELTDFIDANMGLHLTAGLDYRVPGHKTPGWLVAQAIGTTELDRPRLRVLLEQELKSRFHTRNELLKSIKTICISWQDRDTNLVYGLFGSVEINLILALPDEEFVEQLLGMIIGQIDNGIVYAYSALSDTTGASDSHSASSTKR